MASNTETSTENKTATKSQSSWGGTFGYVGVAAACLAVTGIFEAASKPAKIEEFGKIGQEFYESFTDPTLASGLEVFVFDTEAVKAREFRVAKNETGRWVIPSRHDYPADAEERLEKTAASIIGIKRGAMVTRWSADHGRYGVVNPKQATLSVEDVEGVGQRLTLTKDDDSVLADYVIGNAVEDREGEYYVRHPEEDEVYIAKLDIDLSTKFTDWINTKLFDFSNGDVLQLGINNYKFDDNAGTVTQQNVTTLSRDEAWGTDWKLDPAQAENEEVNSDNVRDALSALADLEVIGVRPKQKGLTPDLKVDREFIKVGAQVQMLQDDLDARGFFLTQGEDGGLTMISREGELSAGTNDGLRYQLYFGRIFTGSQEELEVGFAESKESEKEGEAAEPVETDLANSKPGRYLFVRVLFDDSLIAGPDSEPLEPHKSARLLELEEAEKTKTDEEPAEATEEKPEAEGEPAEKEPTEIEKLREEYTRATQDYKDVLREFESRNEKLKEGKEKAEDLNRRFAEWYYVIAGESFDKLELGRTELVKEKEKTEEEASAATAPVTVPDAPPLEESTPAADTAETVDEPSAIDPTADEPAEPAAEAEATPAEEAAVPAQEAPVEESGTVEEAATTEAP